MKHTRYALALGLVASVVLTACGGGSNNLSRPIELTILHINDHPSNLDSKNKVLQLKTTAGSTAGAVTPNAGGFACIAGYAVARPDPALPAMFIRA